MRKTMLIALAGAAILTSTAADAQGHRPGNPTRGPDYVCSGDRARDIDARIERAQADRTINPDRAARLHQQVDRYQGPARAACAHRDYRQITGIAARYDKIERTLDNAGHAHRR